MKEKREAPMSPSLMIAIGFALLILLVTLLLMLPISSQSRPVTPPLTALFTATSAVCVTGQVLVDTGMHWSLFGQVVLIAAIQIGGLGVMTLLALVSMAIIVAANIWGRGMVKIIPILLGVVGGYVAALLAGMVDFTGLSGSTLLGGENPILGLQPFFTDFSGSVAKFDLSAILVMAPIAVASMMEHIGDISAISATVGENFIEKPGLHRTLVGDGVATALAGLFGGPANTTYGETPACWPFPGSTIPG